MSIIDKIAILGPLQQQAEALATQFKKIYVFFNDLAYIRNKGEMTSSEKIHYKAYSAHNFKQEIICLHNLLKEISPSVIYSNGIMQLLAIQPIIHKSGIFRRKPLVLVTSHNSWAWQKASKRFLIALSCNFFADGIFTLATFQEKWLRRLGIPPFKIRTIPNAVNTQLFAPGGQTNYFDRAFLKANNFPIIVNIANITQFKGQDVLIKAIHIVKKKIKDVRLVLMGNQNKGDQFVQYLKNLVNEYCLNQNVLILGDTEHCQIPAVLSSSDISVVSSWNEVCPFVLIESLSVGKVTVSTKVGGIPDIIKNKVNGFLVHPGDVKGFSDCILTVLNNQSLKIAVENNARISAVENYSYDVIGKKHKDFLISIICYKKLSGFL